MVTTCKYTAMDLNETLHAGLGTNDEMCVSFMRFYPSLPDEDILRACFHLRMEQNLTESCGMEGLRELSAPGVGMTL